MLINNTWLREQKQEGVGAIHAVFSTGGDGWREGAVATVAKVHCTFGHRAETCRGREFVSAPGWATFRKKISLRSVEPALPCTTEYLITVVDLVIFRSIYISSSPRGEDREGVSSLFLSVITSGGAVSFVHTGMPCALCCACALCGCVLAMLLPFFWSSSFCWCQCGW